jgi:hypothetical protein
LLDEGIDYDMAYKGLHNIRGNSKINHKDSESRASLLEERALDLVMERAQVRPVEISGIAEAEGNG